MKKLSALKNSSDRRSFLKKSAGVLTTSGAFLGGAAFAFADDSTENPGKLTKGDAALLRFAAAAEILASDFWIQHNELGGIQDSEVPGGTGNPA